MCYDLFDEAASITCRDQSLTVVDPVAMATWTQPKYEQEIINKINVDMNQTSDVRAYF